MVRERTTRREFLRAGAVAAAGLGLPAAGLGAQIPLGDRPQQDSEVNVLNPCGRVPLSFIIDDSTCLVNMGHFCMPQFAEAWPQRDIYKKPWKTWPREIPDAFVREFGEFESFFVHACSANEPDGAVEGREEFGDRGGVVPALGDLVGVAREAPTGPSGEVPADGLRGSASGDHVATLRDVSEVAEIIGNVPGNPSVLSDGVLEVGGDDQADRAREFLGH